MTQRVNPKDELHNHGESPTAKENLMSTTPAPDEDTADTRPAPTDDDRDGRNNPPSAGTDPRAATDTPATPRIKNN